MRGLIVLRCGRGSLHWDWLSSSSENWDLVLCPYEPIDARGLEAHLIPGQKWDGLRLFFGLFDRWKNYDYICLPDDDLAVKNGIWSAFFNFCAEKRIQLAAPALLPASYYSHLITMQNLNFSARQTSFVEIMMPCFSTDFFSEILPTLNLTKSGFGFGLDFLWPGMLKYENIWISDATPVLHTRPVGNMRDKRLAELCKADLNFILGLGAPAILKTIGGTDHQQVNRGSLDPEFIDLYHKGYDYLGIESHVIDNTLMKVKQEASKHLGGRLAFALGHLQKPDRTISRGRASRVSSVSQWSASTDPDLEASGGNDGLLNGVAGFHSALENGPWWQVDFGVPHAIHKVVIYNRLDLPARFVDFDILVSNDGHSWSDVLQRRDGGLFGGIDGAPFSHAFEQSPLGRFLKVQAVGETFLHLDQIEVFGEAAQMRNEPNMSTGSFTTMLSCGDERQVFSRAVADVVYGNVFGRRTDSLNIDNLDFMAAAIDSSLYAAERMAGVPRASNDLALIDLAARHIASAGLVLEFGVFSGRTINHIAGLLPDRRVYGFDSFEGLPEDWRPGFPRGAFSTNAPNVAYNVDLIVGWFDQTLRSFVAGKVSEPIALLHVDCDLYSSTRTIFDLLGDHIVPGTIIVFDEYFNYPEWRKHEFQAFQEFVAARGLRYEYIGLVPSHQQVAVRVLDIGKI